MALDRARFASSKREESKKELLKPDAFQASADKVQKALKDNQRWLVLAAGVVIVGAGIVTFALHRKQSRNEEASQLLAAAQDLFNKQSDESKKLSDDEWRTQSEAKFNEVVEKYGATGAGEMSHLYLAQLAADKKDFAAVEKQYRDYLSAAGDKADLAPFARLALVSVLEDENKLDEAASEVQKLLPPPAEKTEKGEKEKNDKAEAKKPLADEALYLAGRIEEKRGNHEPARNDFDRVVKEFPLSSYRGKAQAAISALPAAPATPAP
jgi:predicted negative regulator of RcsB-dependent stress response